MKIGDIVKINKQSIYSYQNKGLGKIKGIRHTGWYDVIFNNGYENNYEEKDLILVENNTEVKTKMKITKTVENNTEVKTKMKITKTVETEINSKQRELTIVVIIIDNIIRAGYSIRMPQDKPNQELAEKIALGRATNDRTNLVDMVAGKGMEQKYILHAIADNLIKKFERGLIEVKGVK